MPLAACPYCGEIVSPRATVCEYCAEPLTGGGGPPVVCPMCGEDNLPHAVECASCGEALTGVGEWATAGMWRDGKALVLETNATFPARCVKRNAPAAARLKRKLSWHHPALLVLLVSPLIYVIVAVIVQKRATIEIALSDAWMAKRRRATLFGWLSVVVAIVLLVVGIVVADKGKGGGFIIFGSIILGLLGAVIGLIGSRMVFPKRITKTHIWLNGVCPAYLESLPRWKGRR